MEGIVIDKHCHRDTFQILYTNLFRGCFPPSLLIPPSLFPPSLPSLPSSSLLSYYRTPLMLAANNGHASVVRVLIEHGAQVDSTDKNLCTSLHRSVRI